MKNVRLKGKHKLADKWEPEVYVVTKKAGDLPVYTVKPERKDGPLRTLHRDLLLPCGFLSTTAPDESVERKVIRKPRTRARCAEEPDESGSLSEHSESDHDPVDYYDPGKFFEIEIRILSNSEPIPSSKSRSAVHLPGAEPVMEKDEGHPISTEPFDKGNLPEVETSNPQEADHPTSEQPVESSLSNLPNVEVLDESSVDQSEKEMVQMTDQKKPDTDSESSENSSRKDEGSNHSIQRESCIPRESQENRSEATEAEDLRLFETL